MCCRKLGVVFIVLLIEPSPAAWAQDARFRWTFVATFGAEIAMPTDVYIDWSKVKPVGNGMLEIETLTILPNVMMGIDLPDKDGRLYYDFKYPHRSYVSSEIVDCQDDTRATMRTTYYSEEWPTQSKVVYDYLENDLIFVGPIQGMPSTKLVAEVVCSPDRPNDGSLIG